MSSGLWDIMSTRCMWDLSGLVSAGLLDLITEGLAEFYQGNKILLFRRC